MRKALVSLSIAAGLAAVSGAAAAEPHGGFSIYFGAPAPVYVQPPPVVHHAQPPVYYYDHYEHRATYKAPRAHHWPERAYRNRHSREYGPHITETH